MQEKRSILSARQVVRPGWAAAHSLPVQLTPLVGREQEVATVRALLRHSGVRLLTLTGTGGVGKTRLALEVASGLIDDFADGVCFVSLAPISDPDLVVPTITQALDLKAVSEQDLPDLLKAFLHDQHLLLLLDNFEQVVTAAPKLSDLLAACPELRVLVTSRTVLRISGEHVFPVPPLSVPDLQHLPETEALTHYAAAALFLQRAQAVMPDFQLTSANARAIAEICARLDGLPLALELAAARIKLLPPRALLTRLDKRLHVLTGGARDVPARQQTLRNTIAWSYNLLTTQEQGLFRRLSIFVGGCTLEAVEIICNAADDLCMDVLEGMASLLDKSLLLQTEQEGQEPLFMMLETIREYGLDCLTASGEMEVTRQAHAAYYLHLSEKAELELAGSQQAIWLERLERAHDNLRAAIQWLMEHDKEMALRLGGALRKFWEMHGHASEGRTFLEQGLSASQEVSAPVRAKALMAAAILALNQDEYDRLGVLCRESSALYRELGDNKGLARSLRLLAEGALARSNYTAARLLLEEALAHSRKVEDQEGVAYALNLLARTVCNQGEYALARSLGEESLACFIAACISLELSARMKERSV